MMPGKKINGKVGMHASCFVGNPQGKVKGKGFVTFHSLKNKKNVQRDAQVPTPILGRTCKKEFEMIETISKRLWLNESPTLQPSDKNMHDLLVLIHRQRQMNEAKEKLASRKKKESVNDACLMVFESVKGNQERLASLPLNNFSKRSKSFQSARQPTKVTILKKLMQFNKNQQIDRTLEEKRRNFATHIPRITHRGSLIDALQTFSIAKDSKRFIESQKEELPIMQGLHRQQSIQCKGQILGKEDEIIKRRNRMRHLSLIQRSILSRPHEPIFLQQV